MQGLRALQDRGQFTTTLAEVRTRADLIVFVGGVPTDLAPLIGLRCGIGDAQVPARTVIVLGPAAGDAETLAAWSGQGGVRVESRAAARRSVRHARAALRGGCRTRRCRPPRKRCARWRCACARRAMPCSWGRWRDCRCTARCSSRRCTA